ncbi:hypothetical protein GUB10_03715 [Salegentibacter sp. BLCTC]|uniref:hypothetical protein n=1 Tax=Salegentibacter sp. BLCTC TaxID=2697368 RepID=UPI00187B85E0|nr:hypothetical protein [Salegentibacter sp. BLCTC]MBE7639434.1 hypothetical protein [Salegentibacter sp. BLCTC]
MKKNSLFLLILFQFSYAQERVLEFKTELNQKSEVFNIVDEENDNLALFTLKGRKIEALLFDNNFKKIGHIKPLKIPNKFDIFSGYIIKDKEVSLFLSNTTKNKFSKIVFHFDSGETNFTELEIRLKEERFLGSINYKNSFFIFSLPNSSEAIKLYKYTKDNSPSTTLIDFSESNYLNENNRPIKFNDLFTSYEGFSKITDIGIMQEGQPNSIEEASKNVKILKQKNQLLVNLDKNHYFTYLLQINLDELTGDISRIAKPRFGKEMNHKASNSFVLDHNLYQVITTKDALKFHIVNLKNNSVLNSHEVSKGEEIYFKNTPIVQEGGMYTSYREYEKTAKFIRKMKNLPIAITARKKGEVYQINLGSSLEVKSNPAMGMGMMGGALGAGMASAMTIGFNPMLTGYISYGYSRTVEINGLFDKNYKHIESDIEPNIFNKIKKVSEKHRNVFAETIFEKNGNYYWGGYNNFASVYNIYKI